MGRQTHFIDVARTGSKQSILDEPKSLRNAYCHAGFACRLFGIGHLKDCFAIPDTQLAKIVRVPARLECTYLFQLRRTMMVSKNTICLRYDGSALDAATFYAETFPDSMVEAGHRAPGDYPAGKQGDILTVEFMVMGIPCLGLNGGPAVKHNEAFSFQVATDDQAETDRLWNAIVGNGGQENACGWC